jgi:hypothetical protein
VPVPNAVKPIAGSPEFSSPRLRILVDGLCQTAAALDALAEGRIPHPIGVVIGTQEPSGLWFEHVPELDALFEAMALLKVAATASGAAEPNNLDRQRARALAERLRALAGEVRVGVPNTTDAY